MAGPDDDKKPEAGKALVEGKPAEKLGVEGEPQLGATSSDDASRAKAEGEAAAAVDKDADIDVSDLPDDASISTSLSTLAAPPKTEPSKIDEAQEKTRGVIALSLVGILLLIIVASFLTIWLTSLGVDDVKALLEVLLAPVVALVGSATGFYFGGKK